MPSLGYWHVGTSDHALQRFYKDNGYLHIHTLATKEALDSAWQAKGPRQPAGYHYNKGERIFEGWMTSQAVRDIAYDENILKALRILFGSEPRPFQTINFTYPSNQPLHQDGIHFQTRPLGKMVGVWVALEPVSEVNGTLCYVPKSHTLGYLGWQELGFHQVPVGTQFGQYREYEKKMEALGEKMGGKGPFNADAGDAFIWGLELLHGGWKPEDVDATRKSLVIHYFLEDAKEGWAPMFSNPHTGDYFKKTMRWFCRFGARHGMGETCAHS